MSTRSSNNKKDVVHAMRGQGEYNRNSGLQHAAIDEALHLLPKLENPSTPDGFTIADYGCSQGANSILPLTQLLSIVPTGTDIKLIFNDSPANDFQSLTATITAAQSQLSRSNELNIYSYLAPKSFYNPIAPKGTVDVGFSWSSMNYLQYDAPPAQLSDTGMAGMQELLQIRVTRFQEAAHTDLVKFLTLRAQEIKKGGYFVTCVGGRSSDGEPNLKAVASAIMKAVMGLIQQGKVPPGVIPYLSPPLVERSMEEVRKGLGEVADQWDVEECYEKMIEHPAHRMLEDKKKSVGADKASEEYAKEIAGFIVAAAGLYFLRAVRLGKGEEAGNTAEESEEERQLLEDYTDRIAESLLKDSRDEPAKCCYIFLKLRRRD